MAEEGLSNSDWILVEKEKNDLEKLQTNFDKLQKNLGEEKEKTVNLETELKEMDKKILQINLDHKNELEEMRQYFQKLIEENKQLKTEYDVSLRQKDEKINFLEEEIKKIASDNQNNIREMRQDFKKLIEENIKQAKDDYDACLKKKDEKINFLEEEIKMANDLFGKKILVLNKLNKLTYIYADFVKLKNKWSEFDNRYKCCDNKCINTSNPIGNCIEGNGFGNLISDENIKYVNCLKGSDEFVLICAENTFKKPQNCLNYSLFYFEIKRKIERNYGKWMNIGLQNGSTNKFVSYFARLSMIKNEKNEEFKLSQTLPWNEDDIFGCGLVYPSTNKLNEVFPYVFFTQNGKQIGKAILVMESNDLYSPYVLLKCCSIEANFGNDLENKPFKYDISEHLICDEFY